LFDPIGHFVNLSNDRDHFRRSLNLFDLQVMCDCYTPAGEPIPTNKRHSAAKIFSNPEVAAEEPWYAKLPQIFIIRAKMIDLRMIDRDCSCKWQVWY